MEGYDELKSWKKNSGLYWFISDASGFRPLNRILFGCSASDVTDSLEDMGLKARSNFRRNEVVLEDFDKLLLAVKKYNPDLYYYYLEQSVKDI